VVRTDKELLTQEVTLLDRAVRMKGEVARIDFRGESTQERAMELYWSPAIFQVQQMMRDAEVPC